MNLTTRILGFTLALSLSGCLGSAPPPVWTGDAKAVSDLMDDWNDADKTRKASAAAKLFVKDTSPTAAQFKVFRQYSFDQAGPPSISGTTATMTVNVVSRKPNSTPTTLEWSFEKEGEAWKIKAAPMP